MSKHDDHDFDFEPLPGIPAPLPEGERLVWRGRPDAWRFAARSMRLPLVGGYFVALAGWQLAGLIHEGATLAVIADRLSWTGGLAAAAIAILGGLGYAMARNTFYTITSRRVIFRHGVAMPMAINVPFNQIDGAGLRTHADGTGDIPLSLSGTSRIPRLLIWPHVKPFSYSKAEPMLRAVPDATRVARLLADALAEASQQPATTVADRAPARSVTQPVRDLAPSLGGATPAGVA